MAFNNFTRRELTVFDNSSINDYKKCPRRFFFRHILGYDVSTVAPYFNFGTAYHKFREVFELSYKQYRERLPVRESCAMAFSEAMGAAKETYRKGIEGQEVDDKWKKFEFLNFDRLKDSCLHVYSLLEKEKEANAISVLHSEQPFSIEIEDGIHFGGRFDEVIEHNGKLKGRDFKTSTTQERYYSRGTKPNSQFSGYAMAIGQKYGTGFDSVRELLVDVLFNQKTTKPVRKIFTVSFTREELAEAKDGLVYWITQIKKSIADDYFPANEQGCYSCPFHNICIMPTENSRAAVLKNQFVFRPWDFNNNE